MPFAVVGSMGRVVIPQKIRRELGILPGESLSLAVDEGERAMILTLLEERCMFCGTRKVKMISYRGKRVCAWCLEEMGQRLACHRARQGY